MRAAYLFSKLLVVGVLLMSSVIFHAAQVDAVVGRGLEKSADVAGLQTAKDVSTIAGNIIGTALSLVGIAFFALVVYAGFRWMFSMGNDETAKKSLSIIFGAIIGLIITLAAYAITTFVFQAVEEPKKEVACVETNGLSLVAYCGQVGSEGACGALAETCVYKTGECVPAAGIFACGN